VEQAEVVRLRPLHRLHPQLETDGFVRVHVRKGTDEILGATIVAAHAGDLISELTLAMNGKLGLKTIGAAIHPYPTQAEAIRKVGDLYNRTRLTPFVKKFMGKWLSWQRGGDGTRSLPASGGGANAAGCC